MLMRIGDAGEVGVLEFDAGALVAVVEQDVEAGVLEVGGDLFAGGEQSSASAVLVMVTTTWKGAMEGGRT